MPHFSSSALLFAHPLQGATVYALPISTGSKFLLTRPSRGATILYLILCIVYSISTHTPLAGRDCNNLCLEFLNKNFYSHAPRGARHRPEQPRLENKNFYSHAPRRARPGWRRIRQCAYHFYSHAPRGARLKAPFKKSSSTSFLLTRPSRGATAMAYKVFRVAFISTHTPLAGRDLQGSHWHRSLSISTHTPLAGRDHRIVRQ